MADADIQSNSKDQSTVCDHATHEYQTMLWDYINRIVRKQNTISSSSGVNINVKPMKCNAFGKPQEHFSLKFMVDIRSYFPLFFWLFRLILLGSWLEVAYKAEPLEGRR